MSQKQRNLLVAGNWKMHGNLAWASDLAKSIVEQTPAAATYQTAVFPPFVYLSEVAKQLKNSSIQFGGQNCSQHQQGAYTSEIAAEMLSDLGCQMVLLGHSECRQYLREDDHLIAEKFIQAQQAGLTPVLCVGETLEQRESGATETVVWRQIQAVIDRAGIQSLAKSVIAYEPVWAIGSGLTANSTQVQQVHQFIRSHLANNDAIIAARVQLLYGGSCNSANAEELFSMPDVDGGLIGGASLQATDFMAICAIADKLSKGE